MSLNESTVEAAALEWFEDPGYPRELQEEAVKTVLMQAELPGVDWA